MHPLELREMKERELEEKRKKRVEAGIEIDKNDQTTDLLVDLNDVGIDETDNHHHHDNNNDDQDNVLDDLIPSVTMVRNIIFDTSSSLQLDNDIKSHHH